MRNANNGSALQYINAFYIINECIRVYLLPIVCILYNQKNSVAKYSLFLKAKKL